MKTHIYDKSNIAEVAMIIKRGGMIAIPTDTIYGLAINSQSLTAIEALKDAKGRPEDKPFPMMVCSLSQLQEVAMLSKREKMVIKRFMPGALTVIFKKRRSVAKEVTNGLATIGVRMPDDPWVLKLIALVGAPLLVPSANLSGESACLNHSEVLEQLNGRIDGVVKGVSGDQQASTIVDMSEEKIKILRPGKISLAQIEELI